MRDNEKRENMYMGSNVRKVMLMCVFSEPWSSQSDLCYRVKRVLLADHNFDSQALENEARTK